MEQKQKYEWVFGPTATSAFDAPFIVYGEVRNTVTGEVNLWSEKMAGPVSVVFSRLVDLARQWPKAADARAHLGRGFLKES